jgi:hypothetical protein
MGLAVLFESLVLVGGRRSRGHTLPLPGILELRGLPLG